MLEYSSSNLETFAMAAGADRDQTPKTSGELPSTVVDGTELNYASQLTSELDITSVYVSVRAKHSV